GREGWREAREGRAKRARAGGLTLSCPRAFRAPPPALVILVDRAQELAHHAHVLLLPVPRREVRSTRDDLDLRVRRQRREAPHDVGLRSRRTWLHIRGLKGRAGLKKD